MGGIWWGARKTLNAEAVSHHLPRNGKLLTELSLGKGRYVVDVRKPSTEL